MNQQIKAKQKKEGVYGIIKERKERINQVN